MTRECRYPIRKRLSHMEYRRVISFDGENSRSRLGQAKRWLSVPALLLTASDLLADVADAVVATILLLLYSGLTSALVFASVATLVIGERGTRRRT